MQYLFFPIEDSRSITLAHLLNIWNNSCDAFGELNKHTLLFVAKLQEATAILVTLHKEDDGLNKLAEWIEEQSFDPRMDDVPLFIVWQDDYAVHKYSPFQNGVRQLAKEYNHPTLKN